MKIGFKGSVLLVAQLLAASAAIAQATGDWLVKGGVNRIEPKVTSGDLSAPAPPGAKVDVKPATSAILTLTYMVTDAVSFELYGGLPYRHDVVADGALASAGKLGSVKQVSPTLFGQYRFMAPTSTFRPYLGGGLTYAHFYGEEGSPTLTMLTNPGGPATSMSVKSGFGTSVQAGLTLRINDQWFVDASVIKTWLKSTASLSTGQTVDAKLDPISTNVSIGYRF